MVQLTARLIDGRANIEELERTVGAVASQALERALRVATQTHESVLLTIQEGMGADETGRIPHSRTDETRARRVCMALLCRVAMDLRCMILLAEKGYPAQAVTVASSLYEAVGGVAWVGADNAKARQWETHDDPNESVERAKKLTKAMLEAPPLSLTGEELNRAVVQEYDLYGQFCWGKHGNPLFWKVLVATEKPDTNEIILQSGPSASEDAIRASWFALHWGADRARWAVACFAERHLEEAVKAKLMERLNRFGGEIEAVMQELIAKWGGTPNPFEAARRAKQAKREAQEKNKAEQPAPDKNSSR